MGDVKVSSGDEHMNIETLRKLALLSMPKRQGRNSTLSSNPPSRSEGPTVFSSPAAKPPKDKEEGELSSDDDAEGATATLASAGPTSNQAKASLKLHLSSQGSSKEMLAPGANFTGSNSNEGLSTAAVAEAFLASLRIPVPKPSRASAGEETKEDDFVIKFDEDSEDSDGEHQQQSRTSLSKKSGGNREKLFLRSVSLPASHAVPSVPNQKPAELKSEIDRVKKQIAIMERSKVKLQPGSVIPKSTRVLPPDMTRSSVTAASEPKSVVHGTTGNLRAVPDLESLRLQIAAKENELQQRRQRLVVKAPEGSKLGSDAKGIGDGVPTNTLPQATKIIKERNHLPGPQATSVVIVSAEKTVVPVRKEVPNQTEGLIALASIGPLGVCLKKKDAAHIKEESRVDLSNASEDVSKLQSSSTKTGLNNSVGNQLVSKSTKRSHAVGDSADKRKMARTDGSPPALEESYKVNEPKEEVPMDSEAVDVNGSSKSFAVHSGSQSKRKVDDVESFVKAGVEIPGPAAEAIKKLKVATKSAPDDIPQLLEKHIELRKPSEVFQTQLASGPIFSTGQTQVQSDDVLPVITSSFAQVAGTVSAAGATETGGVRKGEGDVKIQEAAMAVGEASPGESVGGADIPPRMPTVPNGSPVISIHEDEHASKIQMPRFQYEDSHALPALAGVSAPHSSLTNPVIAEPSGSKHGLVVSNQQRGSDEAEMRMGFRPSIEVFSPQARQEQTSERAEMSDDDDEMLEQLQTEEELLDKELEEAQEERHRCELRERAVRKEYREAQRALREVNTQCELLNQRREFLLSRIHQAEGRYYSRKHASSRKPQLVAFAGRPSVRLTGLGLASYSSPKEPLESVDQWALALPPSQPFREPRSQGLVGGKVVNTKANNTRELPRELPLVSAAGATPVFQASTKGGLSTDGSITRSAPSISGVPNPNSRGAGIDKEKLSASARPAECADLPSATPAKAVSTPSSILSRGLGQTAATVMETEARVAPKGFRVPQIPLGSAATGLNRGSDVLVGKQVPTKSDGSLLPLGRCGQQGRAAGSAQGEKAASTKPDSHLQTIEVVTEKMAELSRDEYVASDDRRSSGADGGTTVSSRRSMAGSKEDTSTQGKSVEKPTVRQPVLGASVSSADVSLRKDPRSERPDTIQARKGLKPREDYTAASTQVPTVTSSVKDKASVAEDGFGGDNVERTRDNPGVCASVTDDKRGGESDARRLLHRLLSVEGKADRSPLAGLFGKQEVDISGNLAIDYRGLSSQGISLDRVEEPKDAGSNLSSKVICGGSLSEADKRSRTAPNGGSTMPVPAKTRREFPEETAKDSSGCSDHTRQPGHNRAVSVNISTPKESACQSAGSFHGLKDLEPVQMPENLDHRSMSQPGPSAELEEPNAMRYSNLSTEHHSRSVVQAIPGSQGQHAVIMRVRKDDNGTEVSGVNDPSKQRPTQSGPPGPNSKYTQHATAASKYKSELVGKHVHFPDIIVIEGGRHSVSHVHHGDPRRQKWAGKDEFGHSVASDRAAENEETRELKESGFWKDIGARKGVEAEIRTSGNDEVMSNLQTQETGADKEQTRPQLQYHPQRQQLETAEIGTQGTVGHEEVGSKGAPNATLVHDGLAGARSVQSEYSGGTVQRRVAPQVSSGENTEVVSSITKSWYPRECSVSEVGVPSAVGFTSLGCIGGMTPMIIPELGKTTGVEDKECVVPLGSSSIRPKYESPLAVFRAYTSLPQFASAMQLSSNSITWSHSINPHKPLCRFEHRGQCRNDHCPWQHADDYTVSGNTESKDHRNNVNSDGKANDTGGIQLRGLNGMSLLDSPSRQLHDYDVSVPIYRIGYCTLKAEDPSSTRIFGIPHKEENEMYHSFLLSPSIHRSLPSDSPCLMMAEESRLSSSEPWDAAQISQWQDAEKVQEERVFHESGPRHASKDIEMWLELALNLIDYDLATDNHKARDEALCILSRGLETRQNSVTLWMAYSCLFHTRRDNPGSDDMFQFAIQYNPGSYELWLLYINSRRDLTSRLDAYERAVVALAENRTKLDVDSSAFLLDISLQMLYCMCVSGSSQESLAWLEDLIHDAEDMGTRRRGSTSALLSHLTRHDLCILWVTCAYLSSTGEMPLVIIRRLGCKQELPYTLDWGARARASPEKIASVRTIKTLSTAASSRRGCLSLEEPDSPSSGRKDHSKEMLGVNYVQCLAFYKGLQSAGRLSQQLTELYPTSVEIILLHARIEERLGGFDRGLHVFETAVSRWPVGQPGLVRLWNQYAVHGLVWFGKNSAQKILARSVGTPVRHSGAAGSAGPCSWNDIKGHYVTLTTPASGRSDGSGPVQSWHEEDTVYGLINLALVEALSGDRTGAQSTVTRALKIAVSERESRQCWKELACLQLSDAVAKEDKVLRLLDRCKMECYNFSQLNPLSLAVVEDLKRSQVRKLFDDLLGLCPVDHSLLNTVLEICYGPTLLPFKSLPLKDVFRFAEGILETAPGNVEVALSLCRQVFQDSDSVSSSLPCRIWATALLVGSLEQSCPAAPEVHWVEAGSLLKRLSKGKSLEEYFLHALVKYPLSAALQRGLAEARSQFQEADLPRQPGQQVDVVREALGPIGSEVDSLGRHEV